MQPLSLDQKMALLVVPVLIFGVVGVSSAAAYGRNFTDEEQIAIAEAHNLRESGEYERAREILENAGLYKNILNPAGGWHPNQKRSEIQSAIEANDYTAFKSATKGAPFHDTITEETFSVLVQAHELRQNGDSERAQELLTENSVSHLLYVGETNPSRHHAPSHNFSQMNTY